MTDKNAQHSFMSDLVFRVTPPEVEHCAERSFTEQLFEAIS